MEGPVIHLVLHPDTGHTMHFNAHRAFDCWCEPANMWWQKNDQGILILVVEHNDYTEQHRRLQLADRAAGIPEHLAWIDRVLDSLRPRDIGCD